MSARWGMTIAIATVLMLLAAPAAASQTLPGEVVFLRDLGVISAVSPADHELSRVLTRAEFAAIVVRMQRLEDVTAAARAYARFIDVGSQHWAAGHIAIAIDYGMIRPLDGRFGPQEPITWREFLGGLAVTIGHADQITSQTYRAAIASGLSLPGVSLDDPVLRRDAFSACARALLLPVGPWLVRAEGRPPSLLSSRYGVEEIVGSIMTVRPEGRPEVELEVGGQRLVRLLSPALDLTGLVGARITALVSSDTVIAVTTAPDVSWQTSQLTASPEIAGGRARLALDDGTVLTLLASTPVFLNWMSVSPTDLSGLLLPCLVRAELTGGEVTAVWLHTVPEPMIVQAVHQGTLRVLDGKGATHWLTDRGDSRLLSDDPWVGPLEPGDLVYVAAASPLTIVRKSLTGEIVAVAGGEAPSVNIGGKQVPAQTAVLANPGLTAWLPLTSIADYHILGQMVTARVDLEGMVRLLLWSGCSLPDGMVYVTEVSRDAGWITVVDRLSRSVSVRVAPTSALPRPGDVGVLRPESGLPKFETVSFSVVDSYLPVTDVDGIRSRIRDQFGVWRLLADDALVVYDDARTSPPAHRGGVTALSPGALSLFRFDDPAAGALVSMVYGPEPDGHLVRGMVIRAPFGPLRLFESAMIGPVLAINPGPIPALTVLVGDWPLSVGLEGAVVRARTGIHAGVSSDGISHLAVGEIVRLQFDPTGQLVGVTELRARPVSEPDPWYLVKAVDPQLDLIYLKPTFPGADLELLINPLTVIYDGGGVPHKVQASSIVGRLVQVIVDPGDGTAGLLVAAEPRGGGSP